MSQATIERPSSKKAAGKSADSAVNQREKIIWQFSELMIGIVAMVESEEGDCLGRVLEYAGGLVRRAAQEFAESDADVSYHTMLDADSFIQAAAALAAHEETQNSRMGRRGQPGRSTETRRLSDLSASISTAQDQRLTDITSGKATALSGSRQEFVGASVVPDKPDPADAYPERVQIALEASYQIETLTLLLLDMGKRCADETTSVDLPMVVKATGVRINQLTGSIMDALCMSMEPQYGRLRDAVYGTHAELLNVHSE